MKMRAFRCFIALLILSIAITPVQLALAAPLAQAPQPYLNQNSSTLAPDSALASLFNTNLVPNSGAEASTGTVITGWQDVRGDFQSMAYSTSSVGTIKFTPYIPGPTRRGNNFFWGGADQPADVGAIIRLTLVNPIDVSSVASTIDTGRTRFTLAGWFGGYQDKTDTLHLRVTFKDSLNNTISSNVTVGDVTAVQRRNETGLFYRETDGYIPVGTRQINLTLESGSNDEDGVRASGADNLSLVLVQPQIFLPLTMGGQAKAPSAAPLPAPSGVTVTTNGQGRLNINWVDNSSNETGFEVDRQKGVNTFEPICYTKPDLAYCLDSGQSPSGNIPLTSDTTYTYRIRALGSVTNSDWVTGSGKTSPAPALPPSGTMTCDVINVASTQVTVVWTDPYSNEEDFRLEKFIYPGGNATLVDRFPANSTSATVTGLQPGMEVKFLITPENDAGSGLTCQTPHAILPPVQTANVTFFNNKASYPVISLVVEGIEQFPVKPLGIPPGDKYEIDGLPAGTYSWSASTGFWDEYGDRFELYIYTGQLTQPASGTYNVDIPDMTIEDLLTVPPANLGYWEGEYYDSYGYCYTTAFKFEQNGTYTFYNANKLKDSGTYTLVERQPAIYSTKFHVTSSTGKQNVDGLLVEPYGEFYMENGPANWKQITYNYKPQGYKENPFCP
jgi:hypothetical protein